VENKGRIYIENKGNIYIEKEDEKITNSVIIEIRNEKVEEGYEERVSSEYFAACGTLGESFDEEKKKLKISEPTTIRLGIITRRVKKFKTYEVYRHDVIKVMNNLKADIEGIPTLGHRKNYTARPKDGEWFNVKRIFFEISGSYDFSPGSAILWLNKLGFPTGWDKKHLSVDGLEHTN